MNHYIMDYETLINCFVAVFKHYKTGELHVFSVCKLQNDLDEYIKFLNKNKRMENKKKMFETMHSNSPNHM